MIKYGTNNIGSLYFGSNPIGKAYLGSNLVFSRGSGPGPQPTTNVAYLRDTGLGYVDTGIKPDNTTRIVVWARNVNPDCGFIFGSRTSASSSDRFCVGTFSDTNVLGKFRVDFGNSQVFSGERIDLMSGYHKYELNRNNFYIDDNLIVTATSSTFSSNYNIYLYEKNNAGTGGSGKYPFDISAVKIYKNDVLVRDMTATSSGFYDSVSGTTITAQGLTYGTFNSSAYTPLEYIECSSQQYIDTGVQGGYSTPMFIKCVPTGTVEQWYLPISARYDEQTKRCEFFFNRTLSDVNAGYANAVSRIGSEGSAGSFRNATMLLLKNNNVFTAIKDGVAYGTYTGSTTTSFTTGQSVIVGGTFMEGEFASAQSFTGKIYFASVGSSRSLVPAIVNNVVGMYDNYNDVFYQSESGTAFVAGPVL